MDELSISQGNTSRRILSVECPACMEIKSKQPLPEDDCWITTFLGTFAELELRSCSFCLSVAIAFREHQIPVMDHYLFCIHVYPYGQTDSLPSKHAWHVISYVPQGTSRTLPLNLDLDQVADGHRFLWLAPVNEEAGSIDRCARARIFNTREIDISLLKKWISECDNYQFSHHVCHRTPQLHLLMPDKLLLVDVKNHVLRWVFQTDKPKYTALSYVWGGIIPLQTVKANVEKLQNPGYLSANLKSQKVPATIRDCIHLLAKLNIPYMAYLG